MHDPDWRTWANADRLDAESVKAFDADVRELFRTRCRGYGTGVDFGDVVRGVLELCRKHRVRVGANYATLVINALCLDGMAADLLPGYYEGRAEIFAFPSRGSRRQESNAANVIEDGRRLSPS